MKPRIGMRKSPGSALDSPPNEENSKNKENKNIPKAKSIIPLVEGAYTDYKTLEGLSEELPIPESKMKERRTLVTVNKEQFPATVLWKDLPNVHQHKNPTKHTRATVGRGKHAVVHKSLTRSYGHISNAKTLQAFNSTQIPPQSGHTLTKIYLKGYPFKFAGKLIVQEENDPFFSLQNFPRNTISAHVMPPRPDEFHFGKVSVQNLNISPSRLSSTDDKGLPRFPSLEKDILEIQARIGLINAEGREKLNTILKEAKVDKNKAEIHGQQIRAGKTKLSRQKLHVKKAIKSIPKHATHKKIHKYYGGEHKEGEESDGESASSGYDAVRDWQMDMGEEYTSEFEELEEEEEEEDLEYKCETTLILSEQEKTNLCKIFIQMLMDICTQNRILNHIKQKIRRLTLLFEFDCMTVNELKQLRALRFCLEMEKLRQLGYLKEASEFLSKVPSGPWDNIPIVTNDLDEFAPSELSCTVSEAIILTYTGEGECLLFR